MGRDLPASFGVVASFGVGHDVLAIVSSFSLNQSSPEHSMKYEDQFAL